jgi:pimeloyl-ACP methyl ester carboxylesterase
MMFNTIIHRWLHVPYTLKVRYIQRPHKPRATLLFMHGLGNTAEAWNSVIKKMPDDVRIVTIDMLGFGQSPNPTWAIYNAKTQARSVLATLFKLRITTPVIVIGHSMGALVGIEMASRYPKRIDRLILCSPPLYDNQNVTLPRSDRLRQQLYNAAQNHPQQFLRLAAFAAKYKLLNKTFSVTKDTIATYMSTLESMIINQTSLYDAYNLHMPTTIIRGTLDPFVVSKNLYTLKKANPNVTIKSVIAGHEVRGNYVRSVVKTINEQLVDIS